MRVCALVPTDLMTPSFPPLLEEKNTTSFESQKRFLRSHIDECANRGQKQSDSPEVTRLSRNRATTRRRVSSLLAVVFGAT